MQMLGWADVMLAMKCEKSHLTTERLMASSEGAPFTNMDK